MDVPIGSKSSIKSPRFGLEERAKFDMKMKNICQDVKGS
jgi:hypothetical protein